MSPLEIGLPKTFCTSSRSSASCLSSFNLWATKTESGFCWRESGLGFLTSFTGSTFCTVLLTGIWFTEPWFIGIGFCCTWFTVGLGTFVLGVAFLETVSLTGCTLGFWTDALSLSGKS